MKKVTLSVFQHDTVVYIVYTLHVLIPWTLFRSGSELFIAHFLIDCATANWTKRWYLNQIIWEDSGDFLIRKIFSPYLRNTYRVRQSKRHAFFKILKEPMLMQKQTIPHMKALILSFLDSERTRVWYFHCGSMPTCFKKNLVLAPVCFLRQVGVMPS